MLLAAKFKVPDSGCLAGYQARSTNDSGSYGSAAAVVV
jgi:hypothetical protein